MPKNILFPAGEENYANHGDKSLVEDINTQYGTPYDGSEGLKSANREELAGNFEDLKRIVDEKEGDVIERIRRALIKKNPLAEKEMAAEKKEGLGKHLEEIEQFAQTLLFSDGKNRVPHMLNDREAWLMVHAAAPLHDMLKYLGTFDSQMMADHEILTGSLIRSSFEGSMVAGEILSAQDVEFLAGVVEDHENIMKEGGREAFSNSHASIERGKALFFVLDVLTGVLKEEQGKFVIDEKLLDERFVDLYARHVYSAKRKIFRPEWGLQTMKDIAATLTAMNVPIQENYREILIGRAIKVLEQALQAPVVQKNDGTQDALVKNDNVDEPARVREALQSLRSIA